MSRIILTRSIGIVLTGTVLALSMWGCGGANPWETVYPATGVLTFNGKPLADAEIALIPVDATAPPTVRPRARSTSDGAFAVWTYEQGDGAPAGQYKATVIHHEVVVTNGAVGAKPSRIPR
ncbi:MAG: hypothetical protein JNG89_05970, partial [Planctomycetaceae bacterium]|nr:hypothetical protein [Planctomycetaceae bacterium]